MIFIWHKNLQDLNGDNMSFEPMGRQCHEFEPVIHNINQNAKLGETLRKKLVGGRKGSALCQGSLSLVSGIVELGWIGIE